MAKKQPANRNDAAKASPAGPVPGPAVVRLLAEIPPAGEGIDPSRKVPRSFHVSEHVLERARAAAYWLGQLPDLDEPTNVSELAELAMTHEVERLERKYNAGQPFPAVLGRMRRGPGAQGVDRLRRLQRTKRGVSGDD